MYKILFLLSVCWLGGAGMAAEPGHEIDSPEPRDARRVEAQLPSEQLKDLESAMEGITGKPPSSFDEIEKSAKVGESDRPRPPDELPIRRSPR